MGTVLFESPSRSPFAILSRPASYLWMSPFECVLVASMAGFRLQMRSQDLSFRGSGGASRSPVDEIRLLEEECGREAELLSPASSSRHVVFPTLESVAPRKVPQGLPPPSTSARKHTPIRYDIRPSRPVMPRLDYPLRWRSQAGQLRSSQRFSRYHAARAEAASVNLGGRPPRRASRWQTQLERVFSPAFLRKLVATPRRPRYIHPASRVPPRRRETPSLVSCGSQATTCLLFHADDSVSNSSDLAYAATCAGGGNDSGSSDTVTLPVLSPSSYGFDSSALRSFGTDAALVSCSVEELASLVEFEMELLITTRAYWPLRLRLIQDPPTPLILHVWRKVIVNLLISIAGNADLDANSARRQTERVCGMLGHLSTRDLAYHQSKPDSS